MSEIRWNLWESADVLKRIELHGELAPLLASWDHKEHHAQQRLQAYLNALASTLNIVSPSDTLSLRMDIDVGKEALLLKHHDLENYLTPVVYRLGHTYFTHVSARKKVGGGSWLTIGKVQPLNRELMDEDWGHFSCHAGSGVTLPKWKKGLSDRLSEQVCKPLPPGPVAVHLAWRCAAPNKRNWVWLWKPTGDAMGPVLGWPQKGTHPFNPYDDRIVSLHLHRNVVAEMGHEVDVGMWWRAVDRW